MTTTKSKIDEMMETLYAAQELADRAVAIADAEPFNRYVDNGSGFARVVIDGKTATLYWPRATSDCDSYSLETEECQFPASLLSLSATDLKDWQKEANAERKAREKAQQAAYRAHARAQQEAEAAALLQSGVNLLGKRYKLVPDE